MVIKFLIIAIGFMLISNICLANGSVLTGQTSLTALGACATQTYFKVGDFCQFRWQINIPASTTTSVLVKLYSSDNATSYMAQLCKPTVTLGSGLSASAYSLTMTPKPSTSQFFSAVINFGTVSTGASADTITIDFSTVVVDAGQVNGTVIWVTAYSEYFNGAENWIGQANLDFLTDSLAVDTTDSSFTLQTGSPQTTNAGRYDSFTTKLTADHWRYYSMVLTASGSSLTSSAISVCSIHVYSATWCYSCLDSNKAYISSSNSISYNTVTLNLGYIPNIGINNNNATGYSDIIIVVYYQVLSTATVGSSETVDLNAQITLSNGATKSYTVTQTVNFGATVAETNPSTSPTILSVYPSANINIYQPFVLQYTISFPTNFDNQMKILAIPTQGTGDNTYRVKICSIQIYSSGENLPCRKCMNLGKSTFSSSNAGNLYDSISYVQTGVKNYNMRTLSDNPNVNTMVVYITGQVLYHVSNTPSSSITIPVTFTFGVSDTVNLNAVINIGTMSTLTYPTYSLSIGDNKGTTADFYDTRALYFDFITTPGSIYNELNFKITMPETNTGTHIPALTICSVQLFYSGFYTTCAQKDYVNSAAKQQITYYQTMVRYKNDQALIKLGNLCNSAAGASPDPNDNLIRFVIYFQMQNEASMLGSYQVKVDVLDSSMAVLNPYSNSFSVGSLSLSVPAAGSIYSYSNFTTAPISGNTFGLAWATVKFPPNIKAVYDFQTTITQPTSGGTSSFCTIIMGKKGSYIPCSNPLNEIYSYSSASYTKYYGLTKTAPFCSINNFTSSTSATTAWDDDSIEFIMLVRPSKSANGPFSLTFDIKNSASGSVLSSPLTYNWNAVPYGGSTNSLNYGLTYASIYNVNPVDSTSVYSSITSYSNMYQCQTNIVRFQLTMNDPNKFYDIQLYLTSTLAADSFEVVNLFISNVGDNFPCLSYLRPVLYYNGTKYPYAANLDMGNVAYYPIDSTNISSSTIIVEAFIRIPLTTSLTFPTTATFTLAPIVDTITDANLTKSTSSLNIYNMATLSASTTATIPLSLTFDTLPTIHPVTVSSIVPISVSIKIPPFSSLKIKTVMTCVNSSQSRQFADIQSAKITYMGRNINGLMSEYSKGLISPVKSRTATVYDGAQYYYDQITFDFGVITNTLYAQKMGNYDSTVDDTLTVEYSLLIIDESISDANSIFDIKHDTYTGLVTPNDVFTNTQKVLIQRAPVDIPVINIAATILNDTSIVYSSGNIFYIQFQISHDVTSTAEGYNVTAAFYLAPYITYQNLITCSNTQPVNPYTIDTSVFFQMNRLHFGEVMTCIFTVVIDANNQYDSFVKMFGASPPSMLSIPYLVLFNKYPRITDTIIQYSSSMSALQYKPQPVIITSVPNSPLVSQLSSCQLSSSVTGSNPSYAVTSGWTSGYRSIYWYKSGSTYIKVSFGYSSIVSSILLTQLAANGYTTPFSSFKISFSNDDVSYAFLPEVYFPNPLSGSSFTYTLPNKYITCYYLRIHLTNMVTPSDLSTKTSGLIIGQIYGAIDNSTTYIDPCPTSSNSQYYSPRSYLYIPSKQTLFVCDENVDRSSSECYSTTETNTTNWLMLPKIVSTVVFWVSDLETLKESVYGVGYDKVNYVRTDDYGISWKAVSQYEFNTMLSAAQTNQVKYSYSYYSTITVSAQPSFSFGASSQWKVDNMGFYYSNNLRLDWFT